jgi:alkanesulfonate monooxygenase SsuD/methylene tetrahydromethanopterin reductase-like flavin-dependent oxidoreductase (luciferase family)
MRGDAVKFGISYNTGYYGTDADSMMAVARHADECGLESFYVSEHIALYPGVKAGLVEFPPDLAVADPLERLSLVTAATGRILLGTAVLLLPYHHPVVLAKRLATLDVLSKGRMRLLTVGLGTLPGEAEALGVDFATRGRCADEAIDVLRLLWAGGKEGVSFNGEFFSFQNMCSFPKPYRVSTLPVQSADRAGPQPAAPAIAATATSPVAGLPLPSAPARRRSCERPPPRLAGIRAHSNTPAEDRST